MTRLPNLMTEAVREDRTSMPSDQSGRLRVTATTWILAFLCLGLAIFAGNYWAGIFLLVIPAATAWAIRRISFLTTLYLAQVAAYYGLTALVLGQGRSPFLIVTVTIWTIGLAAGAFIARS